MSNSNSHSSNTTPTPEVPLDIPLNVVFPELNSYEGELPTNPNLDDVVDFVCVAKESLSHKRRAASEAEIVAKQRKIEADRMLDEDEVKVFEFEHKSVQSTSILSILSDFNASNRRMEERFNASIRRMEERMNASINSLKAEFRDLKTEFRGMDTKLTRNTNLTLSGFNRPCQMMLNNDGEAPGSDYPELRTADAVRGLTNAQLRRYCRFYGLPTDGGSDGMRKRLLDHLGILSSVVRSVLETV